VNRQCRAKRYVKRACVAEPASAGLQGGADHGGGVGPAWRHEGGKWTWVAPPRAPTELVDANP
jgi:hypothetical protein